MRIWSLLLLVIMTVQTQFAAAETLVPLSGQQNSHAIAHQDHDAKHQLHQQSDHQHTQQDEHEHSCQGHYHSHPAVAANLQPVPLAIHHAFNPPLTRAQKLAACTQPFRPPILT